MTAARPPRVQLDTSLGSIEIELYWLHAPKACLNLVSLVEQGRLRGQLVNRIVPGLLWQTGGLPAQTSGLGTGELFEDECTPELKHVGAGIVSMANSGKPHTNGAQFFVILAPSPKLDGRHTIFGRIFDGMTVVQKIGAVEIDNNGRPVQKVTILDAKGVWDDPAEEEE
jgi:peptidyl-prolyl cis-trans isomerase-like 1